MNKKYTSYKQVLCGQSKHTCEKLYNPVILCFYRDLIKKLTKNESGTGKKEN